MHEPDKYLTVSEVAEMFRVCGETVRRRVRSGKWPAWRDGRQIRFGPEDVAAIQELGRPKSAPVPLTPFERRQRNKRLREIGRYFAG